MFDTILNSARTEKVSSKFPSHKILQEIRTPKICTNDDDFYLDTLHNFSILSQIIVPLKRSLIKYNQN